MKLGTIIWVSFSIGLVATVIGAWMKIVHLPAADTWLAAGMIISIIYIVCCIYEVLSSNIPRPEKVMWVVGFLLLSTVTGIVYLAAGRKRVLGNHRFTRG